LSRARKSRMPAGPGLPTMRREKTARRPRPSSLAHMASPSARGAKRRVQAEVAARVVVTFLIDPELTSQGVREHGNGAAGVVLKKLMEGVRGAALELVGQLGSEAPALGGCVLRRWLRLSAFPLVLVWGAASAGTSAAASKTASSAFMAYADAAGSFACSTLTIAVVASCPLANGRASLLRSSCLRTRFATSARTCSTVLRPSAMASSS